MARFHYFPGDVLSEAELRAACLDGHLVDLGAGFIPADAVETTWMRARSLGPILTDALAAVGTTAAWIHGGGAELPYPIAVQRVGRRRLHRSPATNVVYHDVLLDPADVLAIAGIAVTTLDRTVADLARGAVSLDALRAFVREQPGALDQGTAWLHAHPRFPGARRGLAALRAVAEANADPQDEVTR